MIAAAYARDEVSKAQRVLQDIQDSGTLIDETVRVAERCVHSIRNGGKVMFCGNGGSAADSQHLAAELLGKLNLNRDSLPALALTVDTSALTAIGNDFGYEHVFSRQVSGLARAGDVLVCISTSGRSRNVLLAAEAAHAVGCVVVAMTGGQKGPIAEVADLWLAIPSDETPKIQEGHIVLGHIFCALIEQDMFPEGLSG